MMQQSKKRVFSGMRPTGKLHIGHFLGPLQEWKKLQEKYECFYFVADLHALTTLSPSQSKLIKENTYEMILDWIAVGIDPEKSIIFRQSDISEHSELAIILGMITPLSWLLRCPTFKEQIRNNPNNINYGLAGYPVLQAADILLYKGEIVPVGQDQIPHLEITREIARTFNQKFGQTFPLPKPLLSKYPKIMGLNKPTEKMSKSFGPANYIALSDEPEVIFEKIKKAVTDTGPQKTISPGVKNLFFLLEVFADKETYLHFKTLYEKKSLKYAELKKVLAKNIIEKLAPIREKRKELEKNKNYIEEILEEGAKKAKKIAQSTLNEVKEKIGLKQKL